MKERAASAIALLAAVLAACASRAPAPAAREDLAPKLDPILARWDVAGAPGFALGVVRDGKLAYARGCGEANLEHALPITSTTVFDIGSTSKQFTAACVLLLAQDGALALDDDARKWVPELPDYGEPITIRHLLHHTSGLRDYLTLFAIAGIATEDVTTAEDALAMITRQRALNFAPGREHLYSNSGYFLLSVIVERAAGKSLAELARERIFEPLGMAHTLYNDDHRRVVPNRATGYAPREEGGFAVEMSDFEQTGDGAVLTTVEDLARWDRNFYEPVVGGRALIDGLRTRGELDDGTELDYAAGLVLGEAGGLAWEAHGGAWAGYRAQLLRFPTERTSVISLCNRADLDPNDVAWRVAAALLGDQIGRKPARGPRAAPPSDAEPGWNPSCDALAEYAGLYESDELAVTFEIAVDGGALAFGVRGRSKVPLRAWSPDTFDADGARLRFQRGENGGVTGFAIDAGRVRDLACARR
jgi:CubicO group peptidase (beta-lactamase class C family)